MTAGILVEDFYRGIFRKQASNRECLWVGRICLILVAGIALSIAAQPKNTILKLVAFAWSGLGASFGPVIIFSLYWRRMTRAGAITGIFVGCMTVIFWGSFVNVGGRLDTLGLLPGIEILPGFILSSIFIVLISFFTNKPSKNILDKFDIAVSNKNCQ